MEAKIAKISALQLLPAQTRVAGRYNAIIEQAYKLVAGEALVFEKTAKYFAYYLKKAGRALNKPVDVRRTADGRIAVYPASPDLTAAPPAKPAPPAPAKGGKR